MIGTVDEWSFYNQITSLLCADTLKIVPKDSKLQMT